VALKLLHARPELEEGSRRAQRLLREAQALAQLTHPNVVTVHDVGTADGRVFLAMEYVQGVTLTRWLAAPRPWQAVIEVFVAAGRGLAAAHAKGLVHRDFKPDNVMLGDDGR
jgi:serine/threonine protein kinase